MSFEIQAISFGEIHALISEDAWANSLMIPITPERALSQQKNPQAKPDETCLWVATNEEGSVLGFAGSLPGYDARNKQRMGWNTCWWVDPEHGKEAAMPLFFHFLKHWDHRVAFADMTAHTHNIIRQLGFCSTREELLIHSYLRIPVSKIKDRSGVVTKVLTPLILLVSHTVNRIQQIRLQRFSKGAERGAFFSHINKEIFEFISQHRENDFLHRSMDEYRWIEENPWLVPGGKASYKVAERYPFSHEVDSYTLEWCVLRDDDRINTVMLISTRNGALKVLSFWGPDSRLALLALLEKCKGDQRLHSLIFSHPEWESQIPQLMSLALRTRKIKRLVGVSKTIIEEFPSKLIIQLGDGDSVFT